MIDISINKSGIKIKNIKAGTLYGYNLGVRQRYDYIDGVLSNSLFCDFLKKNGLKVWKEESTRDIICLDFDFGSRSYEEEIAHMEQLEKALNESVSSSNEDNSFNQQKIEDKRNSLNNIKNQIENNKYKYNKATKDDIRAMFYENGVTVHYETKNRKGEIIDSEDIHYKMLYRNASKAKLGQVMFIREELYGIAYDWLTMGIGKKMPLHNAKIVEMSAYAPLTTSTIVDKLHIPVSDVLIVEDQKSFFKTMVKTVRADDYQTIKRVIDEEKTTKSRDKAIANGKLDIWGNPIYRQYYKKVQVNGKKCVVADEEISVKNTLWDGMGLIESSILPDSVNGMVLLRNHFFKACAFRTNIQQFFKDWCYNNGFDYETYEILDMFGVPHKVKDVKMITTDNAIKWLGKFSGLMGNSHLDAYNYWCDRIKDDGELWGVVKTDHPSKLGSVQQMSYQMINTLDCTPYDVEHIAFEDKSCVMRLKTDDELFLQFLKANANAVNHYEMLAALYEHNPEFKNSRWFRKERSTIIRSYANRLRSGKITAPGDNLTVCGNPYALLLHSVGEDWSNDTTLQKEDGCVQCYTTRFNDGEYLAAFRNPQNSPNNICYLHNVHSDIMAKYFDFSNNIMAVNCIETDIQDRANGMDSI